MRAVLRTIHRYLGLMLVLPLAVQGITGALLVFASASRAVDADPVAASADDIVAVARGAAPDDLHATRYLPPTSATPAEVWFAPASDMRGHGTLIVRVNPVTMTPIWPPEAPDDLIEWSRVVHNNFLLPDYGGRSIVGWVGIGLTLLCVLGVPIWWPAPGQWRGAFTFSPAERGFRFHRRLHGTAGIWTVALLLVSGATGAVLGFPRTVRAGLGIPRDGLLRGNRPDVGVLAPAHRFDAALSLATAAAPGATPRLVFLPAETGGAIRVVLAQRGGEGASAMTTVAVNGSGTRVLGVQAPDTMTTPERALRLMRDIHAGLGFGPVWRGFTVVAGLALPVFATTGAMMWMTRNRNRRRLGVTQRTIVSTGE